MRRPARRTLVPALAAGILLAAGCAPSTRIIYRPEEVREALHERRPDLPVEALDVPFEIPAELAELARRRTALASDPRVRLATLVETVFEVEHDYRSTRPAAETFRSGRGDCISATSLFIGLSRAAELDTYFVEALGIEDVSAEYDLNVYHRHVLAAWGAPDRAVLVDFNNIHEDYVRFRVLTDLEAVAHYYNTQGYQALRSGDLELARERFEIAATLAPGLAWIHNNLGVALRRLGRVGQAERALRRAVALDPRHAPAHANLALLLERRGRHEEARQHRDLAERLRRLDPLRLYRDGLRAQRRGDLAAAARALRAAVRLSPRFARGWHDLARVYHEQGDERRARRAVRRALELDPRNRQVRLLARVIDGEDVAGELEPWRREKIGTKAAR
ncbi:MAG: hypothetical protein Kow0062_22200 [Acidobacteriota bacterium]